MNKKREQLQQQLNVVDEEITKLRTDLARSNLNEDARMDWERDEITATKYEDLRKLEARRQKIEEEIDELTSRE